MNKLWLIVFFCVSAASGATNEVDLSSAPLPMTKEDYWRFAIAAISPVIVWLCSKIPALPRPALPIIAPVVGVGLGALLRWVGGLHLAWWDAGLAGAAAVGVREIINQAITKQISPLEGSKTDAAPVDGAVAVTPAQAILGTSAPGPVVDPVTRSNPPAL